MKYSRYKVILLITLLVIVSFWSVWPSVVGLNENLIVGSEDLLVTWILNQTIQKIPFDIFRIFESNIFYPYENTLAYSVMLIPSAIVSYVPVIISGNPITAFNFTLIIGQVITLLVVFLWFGELTNDLSTAFVAALMIGLSQIRFAYLVHLQMWSMYWWLVSAWMFWRFVYKKDKKYLYIGFIFAGIQVWENPLPVFFILVFFLLLSLFNFEQIRSELKNIFYSSLLFLVISFPVVITYYSVSSQFDYVRPIREVAHFSASLDDVVRVFLSPGLYSVFAISLVMIDWRKFAKDRNLKVFFLLLVVSFVFSLGPVLKWNAKTFKLFGNIFIPLPYGVLYYLVPGLKGLRAPSRWMWLFAFSMSAISAIAMSKYKLRYRKYLLLIIMMVAILGGTRLSGGSAIARVSSPKEYPRVYRWLVEQPGGVVLELPAYGWAAGGDYNTEMYRMLFSLHHRKYLLNGATGYIPPERESLLAKFTNDFPSTELEGYLEEIDTDYIVVNKEKYKHERLVEIEDWGRKYKVWEDEAYAVYDI